MELELQRTVLNRYQLILDTVIGQEETRESIVPDAFPDVSRIVCVNGSGYLTTKQLGEGMVKVMGNAIADVLYMPEGENLPRALHLTVPFQCIGDCPKISPTAQCHGELVSVSAEGRILNPRKLFLKIEVRVAIKIYESCGLEVVCDAAEQRDSRIQKRRKEYPVYSITSVVEKPFQFSDVLRQSSSKPEMEDVLHYHTVGSITDAKYIGKKLVCKGEIALTALYRSGSDLVTTRFELPFSQIVDMEGALDEGEPEVSVALKVVECQLRDGELDVSVDAVIQAVLRNCSKLELLDDIYSIDSNLHVERTTNQLCTLTEQGKDREMGRKLCQSDIPAKQVLYCDASVSAMSRQNQIGKVTYEVDVGVNTLYLSENGTLCASAFHVPVLFQKNIPEGNECSCFARPEGDVTVVPVTGGFEVRLEVEFSWCITQSESIPVVMSVQELEGRNDRDPRPSVTIRVVRAGEELWDIAKACGSTIDGICAANELQTDMPSEGTLLLIPGNR